MINQDLIVSQSIDIKAPAEKVWKGMTNPDIIKEYLFGTETVTDWKPGSEIIFQGEYQGQHYCDKGIIKENVQMEKISYTYWSGFSGTEDLPENYSLVTMEISPKNPDHTTFTWTQKGFANEEGYNHSKDGMANFLEKVKEVIER
jgi:uncharacterized protein YndB with AHSA1/START domain